LRRIFPALIAAAALALPAAASAQLPVPTSPQPPQPTPPANPAPQPAKAGLTIALRSGLHYRGNTYTLAHDLITVTGHINPAASGETVRVELSRAGKVRAHRNVKVGKKGNFTTQLRPRSAGRFRLRAVHAQSAKVAKGTSKRIVFTAIRPSVRRGAGGIRVKLLQRQLASLAYATPQSGRFDDGTARAVLAYRKVNRMARTSRANRTVFQRLFAGRGTFRLRYPHAGKHVEADLSRQVLVLAQNGKPWRIYHMSSGKPSTPTVTGSFRFYRKTPGYNAKAMYYSNYFIRGYAIHGYHEVPTYNASHGCLRVPLANAVSIYRWINLGDRIFVYGHG
jgi:hypothetical protein